ncbi:MAG: putative glycoside hydrolase [Candidatus Aminicenantales bacterium]
MKKILIILAAIILSFSPPGRGQTAVEGRGVWAHPGDFGKSEQDVEAFFRVLKKSNIQVVVPLVKDMAGRIFWRSRRFPEAVHPDYRAFDLLRAVTSVAPKFGIKVHAWLCDFGEAKDSPAFKRHPEWAMLSPEGGLTADEKLTPERVYGPVWMCPARRPGYTDQWLLPMIEEIVREYPVDGIHHDYVRYPGDAAPDTYCFCDYCLEHFWSDNLFFYPSQPEKHVPLKNVRLRPEANWDQDFTFKPADWAAMSREEKAHLILEGKSINRADLDYFFYELRCDTISRFVREAWERASAIRPEIEMSAAVFINPMKSGRFIGQRWTDFAPWVDITMTMTYRSHFQGSFEDYLAYLGDVVPAQLSWAGNKSSLYVGLDAFYVFQEEREPWEKAAALLKSGGEAHNELKTLMEANIAYLSRHSAPRAKSLSDKFRSFEKGDISGADMATEINALMADPPPGFFPEEKLIRAIETVRKSGGRGIMVFSASHLSRNKLWGGLEKAFSFPARPAQDVLPEGNHLSIRAWRELRKQKQD